MNTSHSTVKKTLEICIMPEDGNITMIGLDNSTEVGNLFVVVRSQID